MDSSITLPGVTFNIFSRPDYVTGEDEICILVSEQGYYQLEQQAQQRGKTIEQYLYGEMRPHLKANGFKTPPECFFVTTQPPEDDLPIHGPSRTLQ
jgi:hypothetical protein